uniref:Uncharacterized protein n=1 Tax=Rhizophora mucronata TaxID=61149 RepID=A0A2P2NXM2_RHIMU
MCNDGSLKLYLQNVYCLQFLNLLACLTNCIAVLQVCISTCSYEITDFYL